MAGIFSWSTTPGSNTTVDGININEGCPTGGINNALRSIMALVKTSFSSGLETFFNGTAVLPEASGGTGRATGAAAKGANSDITSLTGLTTALSITQGGTGGTSVAAALAALGFSITGTASSGQATLGTGMPVLTWRDHTFAGASTASYAYGNGYTYSSWARAWVNGDDGAGDTSSSVVTSGTSSATVRMGPGSVSASGTLFSIGI